MKLLITMLAVTALLCTTVLSMPAFAESTVVQSFDMNDCNTKCTCAYGLFQACAECKARCERKFWKAWDREMRDDAASVKRGKRSRYVQ